MHTLDEVKEKLLHLYDAELLLELLQIDAEEILDRFEDRLMMAMDTLEEEFEDES